jgi:hypothetical protein
MIGRVVDWVETGYVETGHVEAGRAETGHTCLYGTRYVCIQYVCTQYVCIHSIHYNYTMNVIWHYLIITRFRIFKMIGNL